MLSPCLKNDLDCGNKCLDPTPIQGEIGRTTDPSVARRDEQQSENSHNGGQKGFDFTNSHNWIDKVQGDFPQICFEGNSIASKVAQNYTIYQPPASLGVSY